MDGKLHSQYLEAMGIQRWLARAAAPAPAGSAEPAADDPDDAVNSLDWPELQVRVASCTRCVLHKTRTRTVFGVGDRHADWLVIGEAPGADEDRQGEPFVGRAGLLLNEMLFAAGFRREQVYIANVLKCRPPNNRNPLPEEVASCRGYLDRQIALVRPKIILAVGGIAANNLLQCDEKVGRLRGIVHCYGEQQIPLLVTYHPAYLLRSPLEKRKVWEDLQFARQVYLEQADGLAGQQ
jgi:uracil-DNA glycosylase family 4